MEGHINLRIEPWLRRLLTRLLAILPAFFTVFYFGDGAIGALLILSQVVLSLQLGFAVIPLIHLTSDKIEMREFAIKLWVKILAWISALIIVSLNVKLVKEELGNWLKDSEAWYIYYLVLPLAILISLLLLYISIQPFFKRNISRQAKVPHGDASIIDKITENSATVIGITVDFSKNDHKTIRHGLNQGDKCATYFLVHVVETAAARYHGQAALDHETQSDIDNLQKYCDNLEKLGYKAFPLVGYGDPSKAIAKIVKNNSLQLLVMGAHGHKGINDLIFGTTVDKVRHNVNIPVLIVK